MSGRQFIESQNGGRERRPPNIKPFRNVIRPVYPCGLLLIVLATLTCARADGPLPFSIDELRQQTFRLASAYFEQFQHPQTHVLYGAKLSTKDRWTTPDQIRAKQPQPWGYGSRIADTALHCGHTLVALLDAYEPALDPYLERKARELFSALKFIGGICQVEGLVPRGPHPDDSTAYYDDSSMDQHTTFIISLARYANSALATPDDREWIRRKLNAIGERLEKFNFSIKAADGVTQSHVGFSWKGYRNNHVSILIPTVYALYQGTGNQHWLELHDQFLRENDGIRWKLLHPGDHVELNGHPIYANQNGFRLNAYYRFLADRDKRSVIGKLLAQSAEMQLARDFPGPFYRRFHSDEVWSDLVKKRKWPTPELRGAKEAWSLFHPDILDERDGLNALAHVRFPLGGYHLSLMSERKELIRRDLPTIWEMLTTVDLQKISAAETQYLFTTVALHAYAFCQQHPEIFDEPKVETVINAGIGPTMDVTISGERAYAIGNRTLHVLDTTDPGKPRPLGKLGGLGRVRQLVVDGDLAYVASREDGLHIIDLSDPKKPELKCHYDTIEFATGIWKSGDVLFVACRTFGVELIDVSDPAKPRHLSIARTGEAQSVVCRDGYLYAGVWAASEVVTVDVRNPWAPKIVSRTQLDGFGDGVDVAGNYLYVATGHHSRQRPRSKPGDPGYGNGHGMEIHDLSDPARPKFVSRVKFPPGYDIHHDMWSVTVANGHAFVADTINGAFVVDVRDPKQPQTVARWQPPAANSARGPNYVAGLVPGKDHIYIAAGRSDLHVVAATGFARVPKAKIEQPVTIPSSRPEGTESTYAVYRSNGQAYAADVFEETVIAAFGADGVHLLQIEPKPKLLSRRATAGKATDVFVSLNRVLIAEGKAGLGIYRLAEKQLVEIGRYQVPHRTIRQVEAPGDGRYALVQVGVHKIQILDLANPSRPRKVLEDQHPGLLYGDQMMRGLIDDRYACVFWHVSGLHWYDLKAAGGPVYTEQNFPGRTGSGNGLIVHHNQTMAITRGGYLLLDRGDPRQPDQVPLHRVGKQHRHLGKPVIAGDRLYIADRPSGRLTIADISDLQQPRLIKQITLPGNPSRPVAHRDMLIVPDGYHGLLLFDRSRW